MRPHCLLLLVLLVARPASAQHRLDRLRVDPPSERPAAPPPVLEDTAASGGSAAAVFLGAGIVAVLAVGAVGISSIGSDQSQPSAASYHALWGGGAAVGGMLGAMLARRRTAPLETTLGMAVATLPFILLAPDSGDWGRVAFPAFMLPLVGTTIGNSVGQPR